MLAAERGAAANTLAAYRRDLESAAQAIGDPAAADGAALTSLGEAWAGLAPASLARKCSALRQFYGFLVDEGLRGDDPSPALPRPRARRPLPRLLTHAEVEALFVRAEADAEGDKPEALRLLALLELLYGSGLRASELVGLPLSAVPRDAPFLTVTGKGGQQRMVPVGTRARAGPVALACRAARGIAPAVPFARSQGAPHQGQAVPAAARPGGTGRYRAGKGQSARPEACFRHPSA